MALWLDGSYELEVTGALVEGQAVYIKNDGTLTATVSGNHPFGTALAAKGSGWQNLQATTCVANPQTTFSAGALASVALASPRPPASALLPSVSAATTAQLPA